jgi:hypothetical protein
VLVIPWLKLFLGCSRELMYLVIKRIKLFVTVRLPTNESIVWCDPCWNCRGATAYQGRHRIPWL